MATRSGLLLHGLAVVLGASLCATTASLASGAGEAMLEVVTEELDYPANIAVPDDGSGRVFVVEHYLGTIRVLKDGKLLPGNFLNIGDRIKAEGEEGLVGLALPPDFAQNPEIYVAYTPDRSALVISRFRVDEAAQQAVASSEEVILSTERWARYHHCGHIEFGPVDHMLYVCVGDSDAHGNPRGTAQDIAMLQGKILRLDVRQEEEPYVVPKDNPLVDRPEARAEIWAYGLRNPWRFSFDPATGDMFVPDAGWDDWEEINFLPADNSRAVNFGWAHAEGNYCMKECDPNGIRWPVFEYHHAGYRCSVIGGAVYRGERFPDWSGAYVFGDLCSGEIWALRDVQGDPSVRRLVSGGVSPAAIAADENGEILVADGPAGKLHRLRFPADYAAGWRPVDEVLFEDTLQAKRSGAAVPATVFVLENRLDKMRNSTRWRWSQPFADVYRSILQFFEEDPPEDQ